MIRMIITDLDGTLLHNDKSMSREIFPLIRQLREQGICFVAASGRQYASLREDFLPEAENMYFIAENGAVLADGHTNSIINLHPLPVEERNRLIQTARCIPNTFVVACAPTNAYYESDDPILLDNIAPYYHRCQKVDDLTVIQEEVVKLAILNIHGTKQFVYPAFIPFAEKFNLAVSAFEWMDIMMPNVHKGLGVRQLQQRLHIKKEETMAFGDFMNDYELLQEAAHSYAMKNAIPEIKEIAAHITEYTNEEDGVIRVIQDLVLNKK